MIVKPRTYPLKLRKIQSLLRRLPKSHSKYPFIQSTYSRNLAGYEGEKSIDYYLDLLPEEDYLILKDLRIKGEKHYFQMDTILLTCKYILILEVKNFAGSLNLNRNTHQMIRTYNGVEEAFPDPILQVESHVQQLDRWINYILI
ncbi:nuclease-related domain-containing protein [Halobacillus sp. Marseille-Q1614]|uniref:nuclease-related domain-containing protein n=1 Tax=Halobacillus sp. Marseille-Q1614 TaxID=2709134 RepID=UPI00156DDF76|nr:nuclease-related domain-containing protein [Halobacillus sp. Marseille-Q1614]